MPAQTSPAGGLVDHFVPGTMLGKYELLATIGQGGMANVILARQRGPAGFEKVVVIKVVHPYLAQKKSAIGMLLDEARLAAQIDHPNVVHTYELGEAHGTFYIVMEYLAGESLNRVLRMHATGKGPLDPNMAGRIVADAAAGLHAAHELTDFSGKSLEIVHRDVSPGNIVVLYNGAVKVVDFGIAKAQGRVTATQEGELKGKYGYMSPEQIRNEPMDRRSDVFALGVVLWEALAARRLFQASNVGATLMQILGSPRVPPSELQPGVPPALDAIALKALAIDPAERFQTCAEMKQAIEDEIWQSRCGANEVAAHMKELFGERMEQRRELLARASRESLPVAAFEEDIAAAFQENSATTLHPNKLPAAPRRRGLLWLVIVAALLAAGAIAFFVIDPLREEPRETVATAAPPPVATPPPAVTTPPPPVAAPPVAAPAVAEPVPVQPAATDVPPVAENVPSNKAGSAKPKPMVKSAQPAKRTAKPEAAKPEAAKPEPAKPEAAKPDAAKPSAKSEPAKPSEPAAKLGELYKGATDLYLSGDFGAAEAEFKRVLAADRSYAPAYRGLGILYQRTGETAKATEALRTYLKLAPEARDAASVRKRLDQLGG